MARHRRVAEALSILIDLGLPRAQQNARSALTLLALLNLTPDKAWAQAEARLMGITPIVFSGQTLADIGRIGHKSRTG
jgi:hypothetical protein